MNFSPILKNREVIAAITPSLSYKKGEDLALWQKTAGAKLYELLGLSEMIPCDPKLAVESESDAADYKEYVFSLDTEIDYRLTATLRVPKAVSGKVPVAIFLIGSSDDLRDALADGNGAYNYAAKAIKEGYAALLVEMRSFNECLALVNVIPEEAKTRTSWCACYRSTMRAFMLGRTTMGERVWDIMRVIDALLSRFDGIDPDNISVIGHNGAATVAYYAAAIDSRISLAVASAGVSSWDKSIMAMNQCICNFVPDIANYFTMGDIAGLIAPRKLILVSGAADEYYPNDGAIEAYNVASEIYAERNLSASCVMLNREGLDFDADLVWSAIKRMS